jgi:hypothetical protein
MSSCSPPRRSPDPIPRPRRRHHSRAKSSNSISSKYLFTPAPNPPIVLPSYYLPSSRSAPKFLAKKSVSSPLLGYTPNPQVYNYYSHHTSSRMLQDSEDDRDDNDMIYTSWGGPAVSVTRTTANVRTRIFGGANGSSRRDIPKTISTTPGQLCAGETETEADEPVSQSYLSYRLRYVHSTSPFFFLLPFTHNLTSSFASLAIFRLHASSLPLALSFHQILSSNA